MSIHTGFTVLNHQKHFEYLENSTYYILGVSTTTTPERMFSNLKTVKTYLRNTTKICEKKYICNITSYVWN